MTHHSVKSSFIRSLAHDGEVLTVTFANGGQYRYYGVDARTFARLREADSVGKYFTAHVRNRYRHEAVKDEA